MLRHVRDEFTKRGVVKRDDRVEEEGARGGDSAGGEDVQEGGLAGA